MFFIKNRDGEWTCPCDMCGGDGTIEQQLPARAADLEPSYRVIPCPVEECDNGYVLAECLSCGLSPVEDGEVVEGNLYCTTHDCAAEAKAAGEAA